MAETPTIEQVQENLKSQLRGLYADKSIIEDRIFELKAQVSGFETCLALQTEIAKKEKDAAQAIKVGDLKRKK